MAFFSKDYVVSCNIKAFKATRTKSAEEIIPMGGDKHTSHPLSQSSYFLERKTDKHMKYALKVLCSVTVVYFKLPTHIRNIVGIYLFTNL